MFANRYRPDGLRETVKRVLDRSASLDIGQVNCPLLITAVSRADGMPIIFDSAAGNSSKFGGAKLLDVAMATSAAPTYFPEHPIGTRNAIDGGLIANSPDALALMRSLGRFGRKPAQVRMISVGTAGEKLGDVSRAATGYGAIRWFYARRLFDVTTSAQEALSIQLARELLGDRHIRIDTVPSPDQQRVLQLDASDETATGTLLQLADRALDELPNAMQGLVDAMLRQEAIWFEATISQKNRSLDR
jgi:uncharacterized protein